MVDRVEAGNLYVNRGITGADVNVSRSAAGSVRQRDHREARRTELRRHPRPLVRSRPSDRRSSPRVPPLDGEVGTAEVDVTGLRCEHNLFRYRPLPGGVLVRFGGRRSRPSRRSCTPPPWRPEPSLTSDATTDRRRARRRLRRRASVAFARSAATTAMTHPHRRPSRRYQPSTTPPPSDPPRSSSLAGSASNRSRSPTTATAASLPPSSPLIPPDEQSLGGNRSSSKAPARRRIDERLPASDCSSGGMRGEEGVGMRPWRWLVIVTHCSRSQRGSSISGPRRRGRRRRRCRRGGRRRALRHCRRRSPSSDE